MGLRLTAACVLINLSLMSALAWGFPLEVSEAPTSTLALTVSAIQSARESLLLNIYELTSSEIADALMNRIQAGVHVEIIEEGQPVGGMSAAGRGIQSQLAQAMRAAGNDDHIYEMTSKAMTLSKRRFRFDHGKYAVIDGVSLLIGSENYSPTGNPQAGTKGNRGWEVFVHDENTAREFQTIFRMDTSMSAGDMIDLTLSQLYGRSLEGLDFVLALRIANAPTPVAKPPVTLEASAATRITSPDSSLSGLLSMINNAQTSLDIEQMTFDSSWGKDADTSPLLNAVIAAARRGVQVRVLLNDESVFDHGHSTKPKNQPTVDALNSLGRSEGLRISAAIADIKKMGVSYIHNKGALVDGQQTLVSSINWDENSITHNREAAVLITSSQVFKHYEALFNSDWKVSGGGATRPGMIRHTLRAISDTSVDVETDRCPTTLHVSIKIGTLRIADPEDETFSSLSNTRIDSEFIRSLGARGCILMDVGQASTRAGKNRFIQFRKKSDGSYGATLEGYTSTGKLYSIRALTTSDSPLEGQFPAAVYDGSGPSREKLGAATLRLTRSE